MSFCSKCGEQVNDGIKFCYKCGTPIAQLQVNNNGQISQSVPVRVQSLNEINRMINYFGQKQAQYDAYDNCIDKIAYYSDPNTVVKLNQRFIWTHTTGALFIVFGIILTVGSLFLELLCSIVARDAYKYNYEIVSALLILLFAFGLLFGIFLLIFGIVKRSEYYSAYNSFHKDLRARQKAEKERCLKYYEFECDKLAEELHKHFLNYGYCQVAEPYTNPKILDAIREPIYVGRADTIKESMNVLIQDAHFNEMEMQAAETARQARSAARGAKAAMFFSAASFIRSLH